MHLKVIIIISTFNILNAKIAQNLYKLIEVHDNKFQTLQNVLEHAYTRQKCIQIATDESPMALNIISQMYKLSIKLNFINGLNKDLKNCPGYILIAKHMSYIKKFLAKIPLYYEHRIVCIIGGGYHKNLQSFITNADVYFKDSEALLVILGSKPAFYKRVQPNFYLSRLIFPHGEWTYPENGVNDFKGKEIIVGSFNCTVFSQLGPSDENNYAEPIKGSELKMLLEIFKRLNLSYKIKVSTDSDRWGTFMNGKWTGGVKKMVAQGEVDIANCGLWMTYPSYQLIEMSYPIGQTCLKLLVPRPKFTRTNWYNFLSTFNFQLWIFIILFIIVASNMVKYFKKISSLYDKSVKEHTFLKCFFQVISIFLLTDFYRAKRGALRQLITWLVFFSFVLNLTFSSGLISNLTNPGYTKKIEKIKDLIDKDFYWSERNTPDFNILFNLEDKIQAKWANRIRVISNTQLLETLMKYKKIVKYGQQHEDSFFFEENFSSKVLEEYEVASTCHKKFFFAFANRRGSPFILSLKNYIHRLQNGGIIQKLTDDAVNDYAIKYPYVKEVVRRSKRKIGKPQILTLNNIRGVFFVWMIGMAASIIVLLIEIIYFGTLKKIKIPRKHRKTNKKYRNILY